MLRLRDILHGKGGPVEEPYTLEDGSVNPKYTLSRRAWEGALRHKERHQEKGQGFGYVLMDPNDLKPAPTLVRCYYKDRRHLLIKQIDNYPRGLTPRECARLMGFPDCFKLDKVDSHAYQQLGNAVIPAMAGKIYDSVSPFVGQKNLL